MFRIFRKIQKGEFILISGDCSQGGDDSNSGKFFSKNKLDFPITYHSKGVAANMTEAIFPALEWIFDITGVKPVVAFERQNGGASEMERLKNLNRNNKYIVYVMPVIGADNDQPQDTNRLGWDTNTATRPIMVGDYKKAFDEKLFTHYDKVCLAQHKTFIVNRTGKPEAASGTHDDCVMSSAIAWQLFQRCEPEYSEELPKQDYNNWRIGE